MQEEGMFETKCTECGQTTTVPFNPTKGRPVYCRVCFSKRPLNQSENRIMVHSFNRKQAWTRRAEGWKGRDELVITGVFDR